MSSSSLVTYKKLSPNHSGKRKYAVNRITIHHMAGALTVEQCGNVFASRSRQASSNYGVDGKGHVGLYVDEANRSWASSNADNDNRAITIEVANSKTGGKWPVSAKALSKTIDLCVDICKRYKKTKAVWIANKAKAKAYKPKSNEMLFTVHRWYAATACPGAYLYSKMPYIVKQVNAKLAKKTSKKTAAKKSPSGTVKVESAESFSKTVAKTYKVTASSGLVLRAGAGASKKALVTLPKGTKVTCYGYYTRVGNVKWLYVAATYKKKTYNGFCSLQYLK